MLLGKIIVVVNWHLPSFEKRNVKMEEENQETSEYKIKTRQRNNTATINNVSVVFNSILFNIVYYSVLFKRNTE